MNEIINRLKAPFPPEVVHWRIGARTQDRSSGIALAYIDARDVMKRLDDVCGVYWQDRYPFEGCCEIGIKIDNEWLWRANGSGETDIEGEKGRYSGAFKRAAVNWGIGRYLYYLPNMWVPLKNQGKQLANLPELPKWAIPRQA